MIEFEVIGAPGAAAFLESGQDICFGKLFAKTSPDCIACRAPSIFKGRVILTKELCAMKCAGSADPIRINKLSSQDVMERLERGSSYSAIFREILDKAPADQAAPMARQLLVDRMMYLKTIGVDKGPVPRTKDLLEDKK